jgi:septal ring factor EnvC (AmiA/AmiB activator)
MGELVKQTNGAPAPFEDEILKALIGKVVDLGSAMQENTAQVKKLADQQDVMSSVNERSLVQEKQIEELIRKSGDVQEEVHKIGERLDIPTDKIETLQQQLERHGRLFEKPLDKTVHYRHYVGWPIVVILGMLFITTSSVAVAVRQWQRVDDYRAGDYKWRYVRFSHDTAVWQLVDRAERRYRNNPDQFINEVQDEEERRDQLARNMQKAEEANENIKKLTNQERVR